MNASHTYLARLWRTVHGRNPLARPSDRLQTGLLVLLSLVALAAVPFIATAGSETYVHQKAMSEQQTSTRNPATATLVADGPAITASDRDTAIGVPAPTDATWVLSDGSRRTGKVLADQGTLAGAAVPIWLDQTGGPVDAPLNAGAAVMNSVCLASGLWLGLCALLTGLYLLVRHTLDRFRLSQWQHEWSREQERWTRS